MSARGKSLFKAIENHPNDSRVKFREDDTVQTLSSRMGTGGGNVPLVLQEPILLESNQNHATIQTNGISTSLPASMGMGGGYVPMITDNIKESIVYRGDSITSPVNASNPKPESCHTLTDDSRNYLVEKEIGTVVRRLTPLECERLQGYPDGWTDIGEWIDSKGKKHKDADSPRYKALGNSIALPFWQWMAERMTKVLKDDGIENPTMASLFDGISGFCLVYKRCGAEPIWTSEIEEFPIAVCKKHFGNEETGEKGDIDGYI